MKKSRTRKSNGTAGKQLSLIPEPQFCPKLPSVNSTSWLALEALLTHKSITQVDWLQWGHGWRLAAVIMELNYLGWDLQSLLLQRSGWPKPIAVYSLTAKAKRAAHKLLRGGRA